MLFLKAITKDGETEYFNTQNILTIQPRGDNKTKILMGAGLHWIVKADSVKFVELENIFKINK